MTVTPHWLAVTGVPPNGVSGKFAPRAAFQPYTRARTGPTTTGTGSISTPTIGPLMSARRMLRLS